jgi:hypothetical protein
MSCPVPPKPSLEALGAMFSAELSPELSDALGKLTT